MSTGNERLYWSEDEKMNWKSNQITAGNKVFQIVKTGITQCAVYVSEHQSLTGMIKFRSIAQCRQFIKEQIENVS